jgi:hypothetical protein
MRCLRCGGWMVQDYLMDLEDDTGQLYCDVWRCANCGAHVDPVILRNTKPVLWPMQQRMSCMIEGGS